jgi:hypothetical protein
MSRSFAPRATLLALCLVGSGCARNAIFELELELPAQPAGPALFAVVEASREGSGAIATDPVAIPLATACARSDPAPACDDRVLDPSCSAVVSVVATGGLTRPVSVRVRFCEDPTCAAPADASAATHRVEVERAFYEGHYTQARVCIDTVPVADVTETVPRCDVRCREGSATMQCRLDGTHFCE